MPNNIQIDLTNIPMSCIWLLADRPAGNGYIKWSCNSAIMNIAEDFTELRKGIHDNKLLQHSFDHGTLSLEMLKVYDVPPEPIVARAEAALLFQSTGLLDMTGHYANTSYKLNTLVYPDYRDVWKFTPLVYLTLKSKSLDQIVLAIFDTMLEAEEWVSKTYGNSGKVDRLVFSDNTLTRQYHRDKGYKLIKFRES